jgi:uncharacterized surface protein with fasciclin (FAS1) repeats/rhodanese-related sulfurtransferase
MKRRKMISLVVVGIMVLMSFTVLADQHMPTVALWINGSEVEADSPPIIINDRSMVPLRVITENMGGIVEWNAAARRAEVTTPAKVFGEKWTAEGMLMWPADDAAMMVAQNQAVVLDVRPATMFEEDGVPGALNIPVPQLADRMGELNPNMKYAVYCASDINAAYAVAILTMNNFDAYVIVGGRVAFMEAWEAIDHDMIEDEEEELPSIVDIAVGNENFSILVAALTEADLVGALSGDGPFTVFAPTNAAFAALLEALEIEAADLLAHPQLADVLLYHVVGAKVMSTDLVDGMEAETLQGESLTIDLSDGVKINASTVTTADVEASNGVIHIIDTVLVPEAFSLE